nr:putative retrotransposon protein [Tanacetum cinerariifolium]
HGETVNELHAMLKLHEQTLPKSNAPALNAKVQKDQEASGSLEDLEIIQEEDTHPSLDTSLNHKEEDLEIDEPQKKILKRYCMENSKRRSIHMQEKLELSKSQGASTPAEMKRMQTVPYASAVGSIMYAVRCTLPDVAFAQNITSRFQQNPCDIHWTTVKNILKYQAEYIAAFDASKDPVWVSKIHLWAECGSYN